MYMDSDNIFNIILFWDIDNDHDVAPFKRIKSTDSEEIYHSLSSFSKCALRDNIDSSYIKFLNSNNNQKKIQNYMKISWKKKYHIGAYVKKYDKSSLKIKFRGYKNKCLNITDLNDHRYNINIGDITVQLRDINGDMSWYINDTDKDVETKVNSYVNKNHKLDYLSIESDSDFFVEPEML